MSGLVSCTYMSQDSESKLSEQVLYQSEEYTVFSDRVTQGLYEAAALSPTSMISIYQNPANRQHSRGVMFKFSLNGKDNELPVGVNHFMVLYPKKGMASTPLIRFGETYEDTTAVPQDSFLEPNTRFRILLDMRPVLEAFNRQGYYEAYNGERISREDFRGVYVAGDAAPLNWDFHNLPHQEGVQLHDYDEDGIYETTLTLNEYRPENFTENRWELSKDVSSYPQYESPHILIDALYNLSLEETILNIRPDSTFMAGAEWNGVWTRDVSYSILLSLAAIEPEVSRNSLLKKVSRNRIIQDTGTGGSWPVSTDRTTWALAAWEIYKVSGDREWLQQAFEIIRNTVEDDLMVAYDSTTGLFMGESSFLDWREQTYPRWMESIDIYKSQNLGTNAVHYQTYHILSEMAEILGEPSSRYREIADKIKEGINQHLWVKDRGYYGQYLYGRHYLSLSPRAEGLGESLTVLFDIADGERKEKIVQNTPVVPYGIPSIYPQIPDIPPYHNNGIWPFVQAYWNWAAAKAGHEQALLQGMGALYRAAALFLTNKENMVAENGDYKGTEINSDRQLWSVAGNLAMVYRVLYGMEFEPEGLRLRPFVPTTFAGDRKLTGFRYRNAELDIQLSGWGKTIREVRLDGKPLDYQSMEKVSEEGVYIPGNLEGKHVLEISLGEQEIPARPFSLVPNHTSLKTPEVQLEENTLSWPPLEGAVQYQVWKNGQQIASTEENRYSLEEEAEYAEYQVAAVDAEGYISFLSEPVVVADPDQIRVWEMEDFAPKASQRYDGFEGSGFVAITKKENRHLELPLEVKEGGTYLIDFRYSNGSGPVNTDNKAAIRTLLKNDQPVSAVVFPQRGRDEWSNWGWSNAVEVELEEGKNQLSLVFESYNENMNQQVNRAMLDRVRLTKLH